jgi:hypothetical protein
MEDTPQYIQLSSTKVLVHFLKAAKSATELNQYGQAASLCLKRANPHLAQRGHKWSQGPGQSSSPPLRLNCLSPPSGWHSGSKKDELGYKPFFMKPSME